MKISSRWISGAILGLASLTNLHCAGPGPGSVPGNENGSAPLNDDEITAYKKASLRCRKTGGTRVVKIEGILRCF